MNQIEASSTALLDELRKVAAQGQTVFYSQVAEAAGLRVDDPFFDVRIGEKLDEVNRFEHAQGRPLLSAVVVSKEHNVPGGGFFTCAQELGLYDGEDKDDFWTTELAGVHDRWREQAPRRNQYALKNRA